MAEKIRVGIVGASPDRGWAARAHVPALRALPDYELTAVGTSRAESAAEAARRFGAAHAFTDARELAEHPEVDLVTITVKVPAHAELVRAALDAGKHVYCEWPLARTTGEAELLAKAAREAGVHHAIGLQTRFAPAIAHARELVADGHLGRITSATVFTARGKGSGAEIPAWAAYTFDRANGAGLLEVIGGHTLDALEFLLGDIAEISAGLSVQHPRYTVAETGRAVAVTSPDHVLLTASLRRGAVVSAHLHEAEAGDPRTRIEIAGTAGTLALYSTGAEKPEDVQLPIGELRLREARGGSWREVPLPDRFQPDPRVPVVAAGNVSRLYTRLAEDIRTGTRHVPDFAEGARLHRLLDAVRESAETGTRQRFAG
ncbi:Gfo/Idh/MocA family protein [Amycolatopsis anabasis]|uniref:Gfo/Idh/MocA family protein n=1 Tax=Amycolatopsis anabasis TaxID=1840409 RepID=UPI00131B2ADF|nr:Gfo/Idh/MocA family oxidoreductase [Amycolatopsis anabasis]